jgi:hypothetical protein
VDPANVATLRVSDYVEMGPPELWRAFRVPVKFEQFVEIVVLFRQQAVAVAGGPGLKRFVTSLDNLVGLCNREVKRLKTVLPRYLHWRLVEEDSPVLLDAG